MLILLLILLSLGAFHQRPPSCYLLTVNDLKVMAVDWSALFED